MDFVDFSKNLGSTISNMDELIDRAVFDNEEELISLNTAQLSTGEDSEGNQLDSYASDSYATFKKEKLNSLAQWGTPDLKVTGEFYAGFRLIKVGNDYEIISLDDKADPLASKYGVDIFGLTDESMIIIKKDILQSFLFELRKSLGL